MAPADTPAAAGASPAGRRRLLYLTHPEVRIDPAVPVPQWSLSETGLRRTRAFAVQPGVARITRIVSSAETKAVETAQIIALARGIQAEVDEDMGENDRSATGFLPPAEFERHADAFFARPFDSIAGWERAIDAQDRIRKAIADCLDDDHPGNAGSVLLVGHGGVGTLLYCHLAGLEIARAHDQPAGGGNIFAFDRAAGRMLHPWLAMETVWSHPAHA
jgi:broad specificity phosphatase PhoE